MHYPESPKVIMLVLHSGLKFTAELQITDNIPMCHRRCLPLLVNIEIIVRANTTAQFLLIKNDGYLIGPIQLGLVIGVIQTWNLIVLQWNLIVFPSMYLSLFFDGPLTSTIQRNDVFHETIKKLDSFLNTTFCIACINGKHLIRF